MFSKALIISTSIICLNSFQSIEAKSKFLSFIKQDDDLRQNKISELDATSQYKLDQYSFGVLNKSPSQLTGQKEVNKGMQQIGLAMEKYNKCEKECRDEKCSKECTLSLMRSFKAIKSKENNQHISQNMLLKSFHKKQHEKEVPDSEKQDSKNNLIENSIQINVQEEEEVKNERSVLEKEAIIKAKESNYCHEICHDNSRCITKCLAYIDSRIEDQNDKPLLLQAIFDTSAEQEKPAHDWDYYNQHPDYEAFFACRKKAQTEKQIERCYKYLGKNSWTLDKLASRPNEAIMKETQEIIQ